VYKNLPNFSDNRGSLLDFWLIDRLSESSTISAANWNNELTPREEFERAFYIQMIQMTRNTFISAYLLYILSLINYVYY